MFPHMYKVRHRKSDDKGSSEDPLKPEWQGDSWRKGGNRWPPTSPEGGGPTTEPQLLNRSMPHVTPEQNDLEGGTPDANKSHSPAVQSQGGGPPNRQSASRTRAIQEEESGLKLPGRGPRARSSSPYETWNTPEQKWGADTNSEQSTTSPASSSPRRRRRNLEPTNAVDEGVSDRDSSRDNSEVRRRRRPPLPPATEVCPSGSSGVEYGSEDGSLTAATNEGHCNGVREVDLEDRDVHVNGNQNMENQNVDSILMSDQEMHIPSPEPTVEIQKPIEPVSFTNMDESEEPASDEVANQWQDLLGDALGNHLNEDDEDGSEQKENTFYQSDARPELFQGTAISYIPSSKQDFLKQQQENDEQYILDALEQEKKEILAPFLAEVIQEKRQQLDSEIAAKTEVEKSLRENEDDVNSLTVNNNEHDAKEEDRAWSPGPPIFRKDIQEMHQQANRYDADQEEDLQQEQKVEEPWWEMDRFKIDGVPQAPPPPRPPPMPFSTKVDPSSAMPKMRKAHLDNIKKAVRTRPDWHQLMKDVEGGIKLKKLSVKERNDRSTPILPCSRGKNGKFVYESEKPTIVNQLLHEIQRGVRLRKTRTDDRSKVDFNKLGLKKFRRQLTVEEKKKTKPEDPETLPSSSDDEEDIDHMRDDLGAIRTQLSDEINKSKKLEREKKVMKIDIEALQAEVKKLKRQLKEAGIEEKPLEDGIIPKLRKSMSKLRMCEKEELDIEELDAIETEVQQLNTQIDLQKKRAEGLEHKVYELEEKLKVAEGNGDEWEGRAIFFEKKFKALQKDQGIELPDIAMANTQTDPSEFVVDEPSVEEPRSIDSYASTTRKSGSRRSFASQMNRMESFQEEPEEQESSSSSSESEMDEFEEEEEEEEETIMDDSDAEPNEETMKKKEELQAKRLERDRVYWNTKLEHMKEKENNAIKERSTLRERIKKFYRDMYTERVDYLKAKAELDELVNQLKDPDEIEEEEDNDDDEEEPNPGEEEPGWWFDKPALKPKKLKKRKQRQINANGDLGDEEEDEEEEEDLEDLSQLEEPNWSDSEEDQSDPDDENDALQVRVNFLQSRTKKHEQKLNRVKKDNYMLKTEVERCKEQCNEERLRRRRLDEELNMLLADMQ